MFYLAHRERQRLKMELAAFRASKRAQKMTLADTKITSRDRGHVGMAAAATKRNLELSDITGRRMTVCYTLQWGWGGDGYLNHCPSVSHPISAVSN